MTRRATTIPTLLLATLVLAGCGEDSAELSVEDGPTLLVAPPADGGMDAIVDGELVVNDAGCVAVARGDAEDVLLAPDGSVLTDGGEAVRFPGLGTVRLGDVLDAGGGYRERDDVDDEYADCLGSGDGGMGVMAPQG